MAETSVSFRSAKPVSINAGTALPGTSDVPTSRRTPIAIYKETEGRPYSSDYFDVAEVWDNEETGMKDELLSIEDYYRELVVNNEVEDDIKSYDNMIKNMEKVINIKKDSPVGMRIMKIAEFAKFMRKMNNMDKNLLKMNYDE